MKILWKVVFFNFKNEENEATGTMKDIYLIGR